MRAAWTGRCACASGPPPEQADMLTETTRQFTAAFNAVCAHGYAAGEKNGVRLHHAPCYPQQAAGPIW